MQSVGPAIEFDIRLKSKITKSNRQRDEQYENKNVELKEEHIQTSADVADIEICQSRSDPCETR